MDVNRVHAAELGLSQKDVVDNVITALNSNVMIAPNYWVDRKTGNNYFLTVQYYEHGTPSIHDPLDLTNIPLRAPNLKHADNAGYGGEAVHASRRRPRSITIKIQRSADVYVTPKGEDLGRITAKVREIVARSPASRQRARQSARHGGRDGGSLSPALLSASGCPSCFLYLILVAQFKSFVDPILIMLAIPMGVSGVLIILLFTNTTMNVMSLMGVLMLVGIANSNSILIVDFAHRLEEQGM